MAGGEVVSVAGGMLGVVAGFVWVAVATASGWIVEIEPREGGVECVLLVYSLLTTSLLDSVLKMNSDKTFHILSIKHNSIRCNGYCINGAQVLRLP